MNLPALELTPKMTASVSIFYADDVLVRMHACGVAVWSGRHCALVFQSGVTTFGSCFSYFKAGSAEQ